MFVKLATLSLTANFKFDQYVNNYIMPKIKSCKLSLLQLSTEVHIVANFTEKYKSAVIHCF